MCCTAVRFCGTRTACRCTRSGTAPSRSRLGNARRVVWVKRVENLVPEVRASGTFFLRAAEETVDIRLYFHKLDETERAIATPHVVVVSESTPDGGRPGIVSEVSRSVAARLIAESRARLGTDAEARDYQAGKERARAALEQERLANRVQVTVLSDNELRSLRSPQRPARS